MGECLRYAFRANLNMKPYGQEPGDNDTGQDRPRSGMRGWPSPFGDEGIILSPDTVRRARRRLKKRARQKARKNLKEILDGRA